MVLMTKADLTVKLDRHNIHSFIYSFTHPFIHSFLGYTIYTFKRLRAWAERVIISMDTYRIKNHDSTVCKDL